MPPQDAPNAFRGAPYPASTGRPAFWNRQLKDAQPFQLLKKETWTKGFQRWAGQYTNKHLLQGSFRPVIHVALLTGVVGYAFDYGARNEYHRKWKNH